MALSVIYHKIVRPMKLFFSRLDRSLASLQGYDEIRDPEGNVLKPATLPLASRVTSIETTLEKLTQIFDRIVSLEERYAEHLAWSDEWTNKAEARFSAIEDGRGMPDVG